MLLSFLAFFFPQNKRLLLVKGWIAAMGSNVMLDDQYGFSDIHVYLRI